jgi:adenosylmethionine-8-amino-7-oxononanoate aminotransferase
MDQAEEFEELRELVLEHLWPAPRPWDTLTAPGGFTIFTEGKGCQILDIDGATYIDYWASIMFNNVGYGRKEIADAAYEQMVKLHFSPNHEPNIPKIRLAKKLADITPGSLSKVFFGLGGADAIETALKIAWKYQSLSGFHNRFKVIGGYTYHGSTLGAMSTGWRPPEFTWEDFPLMSGMIHVPSPYCSQCQLNLSYPVCNIECAKQVEKVIQLEGPETIAAVLDTPIPYTAFIPPREYWPIVRDICNKYGILLILDCVQSGFGRFGRMFACEHYGIVPDIMVVAKALACGYVPLSATIATREVARQFEGGPKETLRHSYTFEGSPVACAAALTNLEILEREALVERSETMGAYLFEQLQTLHRYEMVGEIRGGLGLNCAIELVRDKKNLKRFSSEENSRIGRVLKTKLMGAGLYGLFTNPILIIPPLVITEDEIDRVVSGLDKAIGEMEKER